jgi:hypothetical protein
MPADKAAVLTHGICGLNGFGSSASVALTQSLANRLRERLASDGSIEFSQTWKLKVTPAGRRYWAHTASARRISASASSGWPTPTISQQNINSASPEIRIRPNGICLADMAMLAGWRSPNVTDHKGMSGPNCSAFQNGNINRLADQVGTMLNGFPASTVKRGALNPAFTRWLLGFPATWDACAPAATPSSRKLPRSS